MKIRTGFVSNSSSSSFIVISDKGQQYFPVSTGVITVDDNFGENSFGWDPENYYDFESKLIFAYLQTQYANSDEWLKMLEKIVYKHTDIIDIEWKLTDWSYIDHQSNASEDANTDMFESEKALADFLFNGDSFIHTDNDNY